MGFLTLRVFYTNNNVTCVQVNRTKTAWIDLRIQSVTIGRGPSSNEAGYRSASESEIYFIAVAPDQLQNVFISSDFEIASGRRIRNNLAKL